MSFSNRGLQSVEVDTVDGYQVWNFIQLFLLRRHLDFYVLLFYEAMIQSRIFFTRFVFASLFMIPNLILKVARTGTG